MNRKDKIYLAGHQGLVGSAIYRILEDQGYSNVIVRTHKELDLTSQADVNIFFQKEQPTYVIIAAAKGGGIFANNNSPADFIYQNLMIQSNVIQQGPIHYLASLFWHYQLIILFLNIMKKI